MPGHEPPDGKVTSIWEGEAGRLQEGMASELGLLGGRTGAPYSRQGEHGAKVQKQRRVREGKAQRGSFRPTDGGQKVWILI